MAEVARLIIDYFRHGLTRLLSKRHGWLRNVNGLICIKAIQSIDTAGLRIGLRTKHTKPRTCASKP